MWKEIKLFIASELIIMAFNILPNGYFKNEFAKFLKENIKNYR